jgi:hypothetical protein
LHRSGMAGAKLRWTEHGPRKIGRRGPQNAARPDTIVVLRWRIVGPEPANAPRQDSTGTVPRTTAVPRRATEGTRHRTG